MRVYHLSLATLRFSSLSFLRCVFTLQMCFCTLLKTSLNLCMVPTNLNEQIYSVFLKHAKIREIRKINNPEAEYYSILNGDLQTIAEVATFVYNRKIIFNTFFFAAFFFSEKNDTTKTFFK